MLQKYFPVLGEVNSPLASLIALNVTAEAAKIIISGVSNDTLEGLLWSEVEETETRKQEIEVSIADLEAARVAAAKELRTLRYCAAQAARKARAISRNSRQVKAVRKPLVRNSHKTLKGLSLEACRQKAAATQTAVRSAVTVYNAATQAVELAIQGGDCRTTRSKVAALKVAVRELEIAHLNFRFAREMLAISLARHSA